MMLHHMLQKSGAIITHRTVIQYFAYAYRKQLQIVIQNVDNAFSVAVPIAVAPLASKYYTWPFDPVFRRPFPKTST